MTPTTEFVMPKLGLTMTEGRIARWVVTPGAQFAAGDVIVEIETDKIVNEVEAPSAGRLLELLEPEGTTMPVGAPIARWQPLGGGAALTRERAEKPAPEASPAEPPDANAQLHGPHRRSSEDEGRILSTPYARKLAREAGLDIAAVKGTGPRGRIKAVDVERTHTAPQVPAVRVDALTPSHARAAPPRTRDLSLVTITVDAGRLREVERSLSSVQPGVHRLHVIALACVRALAAMEDTGNTLPIGLAIDASAGRQPTLLAHPRTTISALMAQSEGIEARAGQGRLRQEETEGGRLLIFVGNDAVGVFGPAAPQTGMRLSASAQCATYSGPAPTDRQCSATS